MEDIVEGTWKSGDRTTQILNGLGDWDQERGGSKKGREGIREWKVGGRFGGQKPVLGVSTQASLLRREVGVSLCCVTDSLKVSICLILRSYAVLIITLNLHTRSTVNLHTRTPFRTGLTTLV